MLRFAPAPAPGRRRAEDGERRELPSTAFNSPLHSPLPPSPRMRYHNVTTRDSLALLLKVKIPVGAGAILRRASLQASSSSRSSLPSLPFAASLISLPLCLSVFPRLSLSFALFPTRSIYVLLFFSLFFSSFFLVNSYKRLLARYSMFITAAGSNRV